MVANNPHTHQPVGGIDFSRLTLCTTLHIPPLPRITHLSSHGYNPQIKHQFFFFLRVVWEGGCNFCHCVNKVSGSVIGEFKCAAFTYRPTLNERQVKTFSVKLRAVLCLFGGNSHTPYYFRDCVFFFLQLTQKITARGHTVSI
jgi:hypothetical protein